jgi:hypothetical protein
MHCIKRSAKAMIASIAAFVLVLPFRLYTTGIDPSAQSSFSLPNVANARGSPICRYSRIKIHLSEIWSIFPPHSGSERRVRFSSRQWTCLPTSTGEQEMSKGSRSPWSLCASHSYMFTMSRSACDCQCDDELGLMPEAEHSAPHGDLKSHRLRTQSMAGFLLPGREATVLALGCALRLDKSTYCVH